MRIGMLTGGGDCPGLNAVIRAVVRKGIFHYNDDFMGYLEGWRGVMDDNTMPLNLETVAGILPRGGTILRTSRTNPSKREGGLEQCLANLNRARIDALICIGGDDTNSVTQQLHERGFRVVGIPKTIDNDLNGTDQCFGFDTAVTIATEAIDRVHTTAEAHNRVIVVEVMGRDSGWIAIYSGIAGGADVIIIPERPFHITEIAESLKRRHERGRYFSIVVIAEGAKMADENDPSKSSLVTTAAGNDEFGHARLGGVGTIIAGQIEKLTGYETRAVILGHTQRGGSPTAFDRVLASRYGIGAIDLVHSGGFGQLVALRQNKIIGIPLIEALAENRKVPTDLIEVALGLQDKAIQPVK